MEQNQNHTAATYVYTPECYEQAKLELEDFEGKEVCYIDFPHKQLLQNYVKSYEDCKEWAKLYQDAEPFRKDALSLLCCAFAFFIARWYMMGLEGWLRILRPF